MISKTIFLSYQQCPKNLWLELNKPEEAKELGDLEEGLIETGIEVGEYARHFRDNTFDARRKTSDDKPDLDAQVEATKFAMANGFETIAEASFQYEDLFCAVDLLIKDIGGWAIYEVKGSSHYKEKHFYDIAFQKYVLTKCGINVTHTYIMHLNKNYVRHGDIDVKQLFAFEDVDDHEDVNLSFENIEYALPKIREVLKAKEEIDVDFRKECKGCPFHEHCTKDLPHPNISEISNIRADKAYSLINQGIITPADFLAAGNVLSKKRQKVQLEAIVTGKDEIIDKEAVKEFLATLSYPLYHLDFETFMDGVPQFDGEGVYETIPFQYSLHIETKKGGPYIHKEFLGDKLDCDRELALQLLQDIPPHACVIAFHSSTEAGIIKRLAEKYPDLRDELLLRVEHVVDLWNIFRNGHYYHIKQGGSNSIKYVMPALCPHMEEAYHELPVVHNGGEALTMFLKLVKMTGEEYQKTRDGMLKYCELDTWSMVEILKVVYSKVD